jgi:fructose-specific PTS system IIA-like component
MSTSYPFTFPLANGLHARPASHLQAVANRFASEVSLRVCPAGGGAERSGNAKSVLSLTGLDVQAGEPCVLTAAGPDELQAIEALCRFVREVLAGTDDGPAVAATGRGPAALPRSLKATGLTRFFAGAAVSGGVGKGATVIAQSGQLHVSGAGRRAGPAADESRRLEDAMDRLKKTMASRARAASRPQEREVLGAHIAILEDVELRDRAMHQITSSGASAATAVLESAEHFASVLGSSRSAYLRERALDVRDVCGQLLEGLGERTSAPRVRLTGPTIYVAESLAPSELLGLEREHLRGLVLRDGGSTSHTVILARSMGIPTLVGVEEAPRGFCGGEEALVDGELGIAIPEVTEEVGRYYALESRRLEAVRRAGSARRFAHARTLDGREIEVGCNVASAAEVGPGVEAGADGIGLFRTEMLFVDRSAPPTEEEQLESYNAAVRDAKGRPVIVRLIDIGGDKEADYLGLAEEANPFLGYRGVRIYAEHRALVHGQIRAVLRASAGCEAGMSGGGIKLLVPMVSCLEELRLVRSMVADAAAELEREGRAMGLPPIGVMIEVPSAVMLVPELAREADFFSIGSNDLAQYCMAADRGNSRVSPLGAWSQPGFLRMLKLVVDSADADARATGSPRRWIGLCGEMGDSPEALPLLVGLGLDEVSVSSPRIASAKRAVGELSQAACAKLVADAAACATRAEVEALLASRRGSAAPLPMLSDDVIVLDCDARTKEEAIKVLCDALAVGGWTDRPAAVEEAVWRREDTYSTGFGHGFAVPHCKSEHVRAHAIAVARLTQPLDWGSTDGEPVDVVILLAIRADAQERAHMKVFSQLSRLAMREEFRERVRAERTPRELRTFLETSLGIGTATVTTSETAT